MSHSGSFLVGSQLDPTLALLMPSPGRLVPGAIPLPSRARPASVGEASSGDFRDLVQRRSALPPGNVPGNAPSPIHAEAPSPQGTVPGIFPGVLPVVLTDKNTGASTGANTGANTGETPDTNIVALPQTPSIEPQTSDSLQPAPGPLPEKRPTSSSNLAADLRQALAHYRAAALQLG